MKIKSKAEQLYENLILYISETPILPGEALPPERKLAELFQSSRNSIREAFRMLQAKNLIEVRKGSGCYVKRPFIHDKLDESCSIQIDCIDSAELLMNQLEARSLLVPRLIQLAMSNMTTDYFKRLERILIQLSKAVIARNYQQIIEEDTKFHRVLTEATGNRLLMMLYRPLEMSYNTAIDIFSRLSEQEINEIFAGYVGILNALRKNDLDNIESQVKKTMETMQHVLAANQTSQTVKNKKGKAAS